MVHDGQDAVPSLNMPSNSAREREASGAAFEFVRELATELSAGTVELPSFPKVAARVQKILAEDSSSAERVVRVLGAEPMLATRVLFMANSAALSPGGRPVSELKAAVTRLGFDALRAAVISYAMAQLRSASAFKGIERQLSALWQHSVVVAALCFVIARRTTRGNADTAMLAGLVHGVGKLYILTRAMRHPALFADTASYERIVEEWHGGIAKALLESWHMAEDIVAAVSAYSDASRELRGPAATLADLLEVAELLAAGGANAEQKEARLGALKAAQRLGIQPGSGRALIDESATELASLREALGQ